MSGLAKARYFPDFDRWPKARVFFCFCLSFIAGLAAAAFSWDYFHPQTSLVFLAAVLALAAGAAAGRKKFFVPALLAAAFFCGFWRLALANNASQAQSALLAKGQEIALTGVISGEPDQRQTHSQYTLGDLRLPQTKQTLPGKILVFADTYPLYQYGDQVLVSGLLAKPEPVGGFAYDRFLRRHGIWGLMYYPRLELAAIGQGVWFWEKIFSAKNRFRQAINIGLSGEAADLARAMLLGDKREIGAGLRTDLSRTGLSHLAAISGLHISLVATLAMSFLLALGCPRRWSFYSVTALLFFYILLVGLPASALRAGLMGFLALWASYLGRFGKLTNSLVLAAALLLMANPWLLRDDIGFQLSFSATLGLAWFYPLGRAAWQKLAAGRYFVRVRLAKAATEAALVTLSAQTLAGPLVVHYFGILSLIAPLANVLVLWTLPFLMVSALVALVLGAFWPAAAPWFFLPARVCLDYLLLVVHWGARVPGAYQTVFPRPIWYAVYGLLMLWLWRRGRIFKSERGV